MNDRTALNGILFVLTSGIPWERLPQDMGYGSGMTCWRRLRDWQQAGIWEAVQQVLVQNLEGASRINWERAYAGPGRISPDGGVEAMRMRRSRRN